VSELGSTHSKATSGSEYLPSTAPSSDSCQSSVFSKDKTTRALVRQLTIDMMSKSPATFMGVPKEHLYIVEMMAAKLGKTFAVENVMLTLRKLKLMESHKILGLFFGLSKSEVSKIFRKTLPTLAECMKDLIFYPDVKQTILNLPTAFRYQYFETTDIADGFEVQIQKPTNALHQILSYSAYKSCNTVKFIVNITPDGFVSFISKGYGGRISDVSLCQESGYLDSLASGRSVMADRGFKHLDSHLELIGVKLVRPPSVFGNQPLTKQECSGTKQIAALRIHVERLIGRLRSFAFIAPHSTIPVPLIPYIDCAVIVAAGLTNLANVLIKV